jgi:protein-L-isoaspartate O-methyltransferase
MLRTDNYVEIIKSRIALGSMNVLEVGSGTGVQTEALVRHCGQVIGIEPDGDKVAKAKARRLPRSSFVQSTMEDLTKFSDARFDLTVFTNSLHHIKPSKMPIAIDKAVKLTLPGRQIVFIEPEIEGSLYEAEKLFDAWDGNEDKAKRVARGAISEYPRLAFSSQAYGHAEFEFDNEDDFIAEMKPKKNLDKIESYLDTHYKVLKAPVWIGFFSIRR